MVTGIVSKVLTKAWNGKTFYSLALVNDKIYGFGMKNPKANPGDTVAFESTVNAKGYPEGDFNTLKVTKGEPAVVSGGSVGASRAMGKDDYWTRKEARDVENDKLRTIGAGRNTAIAWIDLLLKNEVIKLPAKAADREKALNAILADYTLKFAGKDEPAPATEPEEAQEEPATQEEWS